MDDVVDSTVIEYGQEGRNSSYIISRYSKVFLGQQSSNRSGVVEIDEFAVIPLLCVFVSFGNKVDI